MQSFYLSFLAFCSWHHLNSLGAYLTEKLCGWAGDVFEIWDWNSLSPMWDASKIDKPHLPRGACSYNSCKRKSVFIPIHRVLSYNCCPILWQNLSYCGISHLAILTNMEEFLLADLCLFTENYCCPTLSVWCLFPIQGQELSELYKPSMQDFLH